MHTLRASHRLHEKTVYSITPLHSGLFVLFLCYKATWNSRLIMDRRGWFSDAQSLAIYNNNADKVVSCSCYSVLSSPAMLV